MADGRLTRYAAALESAGADAFVLTSEPALQHAIGIRLYSQRLIPQRPVICIVAPGRRPVCVCVEYEVGQLGLEAPALELRPFGEFSGDPWRITAEVLAEVGAKRVVVEDTFLAPWLAALQARFPGEIDASYELPLMPRTLKEPSEIEVIGEASRGAEIALAAGAAVAERGRTEIDVARAIVLSFVERFGDRAAELTGICTAPQNNRAMHHRAGPAILPESGPVRVGLVARLDGYWVLLTRMFVLGRDDRFERAYASYAACYEENLASLRQGEECSALYAAADVRVREGGMDLTSEKIGHGTGLDFRELPWIAGSESATLSASTVLAYDYGADLDGYMLHVEDRVLIDVDGPRRLSSGWDLQDARGGFRGLL